MNAPTEKRKIPLIKETRLDKITTSLECFHLFHLDRNAQRNCIMKEYPGKSEKSAFRGMVIPSIRHLGLILGTVENITVSSNGLLLLAGKKRSEKEVQRIACALLLELDRQGVGLIQLIKSRNSINLKQILCELEPIVESVSKKQSNERIKRWLNLLVESKIVIEGKQGLYLDSEKSNKAEKDLNIGDKEKQFETVFLKAYKNLLTDNLGIIRISRLREETSKIFYSEFNQVITENQFDLLLSKMPHVTNEYILSFGEPIGADEKLFNYHGRYFKTLNIKFFKRGT